VGNPITERDKRIHRLPARFAVADSAVALLVFAA
jgi:hypothetical protein